MNSNHAIHAHIADTVRAAASVMNSNAVTISLSVAALRQHEVQDVGGVLAATTGKFTGRSPTDKYIVRGPATDAAVWWETNQAMEAERFDLLMGDMLAHAAGRPIFEQQLHVGADSQFRQGVSVYSESAWHALFIRHLLIRPREQELVDFRADATVLHLPSFCADPDRHGTRTETVIALDLERNVILIGGTAYAGEIKKGVFTLFNHRAPDWDVLPMHCSANVGRGGDTALFFGLSGTGKTTLSTSPERALVGDDEHGWSPHGVFNLEGGCYAKAIGLSEAAEPEIYRSAQRGGAILENVVIDPASGQPDFDDASLTENTRIAYPLDFMPNRVPLGMAPHPGNVVLLTADAFGVLPPISRLDIEQTVAMFLAGYTAKVAGTERGVTEPVATFSACFGAPFMPRHPRVYAAQLTERLRQSQARCWLINTGWTGGGYGVGERIALAATRRMLEAALSGELEAAGFRADPTFGLKVPVHVAGVPDQVLNPIETWADRAAYRDAAGRLIDMFERHLDALGHPDRPFASADAARSDAA